MGTFCARWGLFCLLVLPFTLFAQDKWSGFPQPEMNLGDFEAAPATSYVEIILDASSNMAKEMEGGRKFDLAVKEVKVALRKLSMEAREKTLLVSLRVSGGLASKSCQDSRLLYPFGPVHVEAISDFLNDLEPQGLSSVAHALRAAAKDFPEGEGPGKSIILITDGREDCGKNPCAACSDLAKPEIGIKVNVIGLDLTQETAQTIGCIANLTHGTMALAGNSHRLTRSMDQAVSRSLEPPVLPPIPGFDFPIASQPAAQVTLVGAGIGSAIFPGFGYFTAKEKGKGFLILGLEAAAVAGSSHLQSRYRREASEDFPLPSFYLSLMRYGTGVGWFSQTVGAVIAVKRERGPKIAREPKSPVKAASLSLLLPGLGDFYVGSNPEIGISMIGMSLFFIARAVSPLGYQSHLPVRGKVFKSPHFQNILKGRDAKPNEEADARTIRRISLYSLGAMQIGSAMTASASAFSGNRKLRLRSEPPPLGAGLYSLFFPGAGYMVTGHPWRGLSILLAEGGMFLGYKEQQMRQKREWIETPRLVEFYKQSAGYGAATLHLSQTFGAIMSTSREYPSERKSPLLAATMSLLWPGSGDLYAGRNPGWGLWAMSLSAYSILRTAKPLGSSRAMVRGKFFESPEFSFPWKEETPTGATSNQAIKIRDLSTNTFFTLQGLSALSSAISARSKPRHAKAGVEWKLGLAGYHEEGPLFGLVLNF